jgi:formate-dependent nitrite reductase membrane component NrfD
VTPEMNGDGRHIDTTRGSLIGEGAEQRVSSDREPLEKSEPHVFTMQPARQPGLTTGDATYYDRPVLKRSPWSWDIPAYYYVGGATGAAAAFGAAATLLDHQGMANVVRYSRWIGPIGGGLSGFFLIHDLGRPERFHHMLRVFRPTSPMSVGTYILSIFSSLIGLSWMALFVPKPFTWISDLAAIPAGLFGLGLAGYTGVLVSNTTVPVWQRAHRLLPVLFLASATSSAASLFDILGGNEVERKAVRTFGIVGKIGELVAAEALEHAVATVPEAVKPLQEGVSGMLWTAGKVFTAASLVLALYPRPSRSLRIATGIFGTAGAMCVRFGIHYAGRQSAMNPRATFHQQRQGQGAFEVTGKAAVTGPGGERAFTG